MVAKHQHAVAERLGRDDGILVIDDTGFCKQGVFSCGVGRQYSGSLGKVENCQVGVFLSYAVPEGTHTFLDRRLYLKKEWFTPDWDPLRTRARVPQDVVFRKKPELALEMIEGALGRKIPYAWVSMDAGYGEVPELLDALEALGELGVGSRLYPTVRGADLIAPVLLAALTALPAAIWPALKAARLGPAEALRHI